jgi:hypothetical protein
MSSRPLTGLVTRLFGKEGAISISQETISSFQFQDMMKSREERSWRWGWERHVVTLKPPNSWHSQGWGNYSESILDYKLSELPNGRTKLDMRWSSRPGMMSKGKRASKQSIEGYVTRLWRRRAKYRKRIQKIARLKKWTTHFNHFKNQQIQLR